MADKLAKKENNNLVKQEDYKKLAVKYLDVMGIGKTLTEEQKQYFIEIAEAFGLNPFKREIHPIPFKDKQKDQTSLQVVTGYEVYLKRAERSGKLDGWNISVSGKLADGTLSATVKIWRKDWREPFQHTVYFKEYAKKHYDREKRKYVYSGLWGIMPITMIKKVAIAQGFRLAFPDELGGMPYTVEEQWEQEVIENLQESKPELQANKQEEIAELEGLERWRKKYKSFLNEMADIKAKIGEERYYELLSSLGFSKANEVKKMDDIDRVLKAFRELEKKLNESEEIEAEVEEEEVFDVAIEGEEEDVFEEDEREKDEIIEKIVDLITEQKYKSVLSHILTEEKKKELWDALNNKSWDIEKYQKVYDYLYTKLEGGK